MVRAIALSAIRGHWHATRHVRSRQMTRKKRHWSRGWDRRVLYEEGFARSRLVHGNPHSAMVEKANGKLQGKGENGMVRHGDLTFPGPPAARPLSIEKQHIHTHSHPSVFFLRTRCVRLHVCAVRRSAGVPADGDAGILTHGWARQVTSALRLSMQPVSRSACLPLRPLAWGVASPCLF